MKLQILDVDYFFNGTKPVLRIFGRTEKGNAVCCFYDKLRPYFYVTPLGNTESSIKKIKSLPQVIDVQETEMFTPKGYQKDKTKMLIITIQNPKDVPEMRERLSSMGFKATHEADILFRYRFMVDHDIYGMQWAEVKGERTQTKTTKIPSYYITEIKPVEKSENTELRHISFDIECVSDDENRMPDAKKDPIVMISMSFSPGFRGQKNTVFVGRGTRGEGVRGFAGEKEMLEGFLKLIEDFDPDVITGYNINAFDLPYIVERLRKHNLSTAFGRTDKPVYSKKFAGREEFIVTGRVVFDPYEVIKRDPWLKFHRYDLNTVAMKMLGEGKHDVEYREMAKLWKGDQKELKRLIEYARKDSELCLRLVKEKGLLDKFIELAKISGLLLQDTFGGQTRRVEMMMLHEFKKRGFVMPTQKSIKASSVELKGATVLEPEKGLHADGCVLVLDFKSLYPSIIRTYNISPDTLITDKKDENFKIDAYESPSGARFVDAKIKTGILPTIVSDLIVRRANIKKNMRKSMGEEKKILNAKQLALKDMSNSVHADTDIVVKDPEGNVRVMEIEKLYSTISQKNESRRIGESDYIELSGWQALSVDHDKTCFRPLYAISRHNSKGRLFRIKTRMGEVKVTADHSIMEMLGEQNNRIRHGRFEGLKEVKGDKINKSTVIAQINNARLPETTKKHINLLDILLELPDEEIEDLRLFIPKKLNLNKHEWYKNRKRLLTCLNQKGTAHSQELQNILNIDRRMLRASEPVYIERTGLTTSGNCGIVPTYKITEEGESLLDFYSAFSNQIENPNYYTIPITLLKDTRIPKNILKHSGIAVGGPHKGRRKMEVLIPFTEELSELLGWYVAEGSCYKRKHRKGTSYKTTISMQNKEYATRITELIKKVFNYRAKYDGKNININLKVAYLLLKKLCGKSAYKKQIPDIIVNSNYKTRKAFLDSYLKGDGNVDKMRFNTNSKKLAAQTSLLLKEWNGITHTGQDGKTFRTSLRRRTQGNKIVSGDLYGQNPIEVEEVESSPYVYDLSVDGTEMFVTAQGIVLHNSIYGYTGYVRAKLYVMDVANSITSYGRKNLLKTKNLIEETFGVKVIYADTDSAFIKADTKNLDEARELGEKIAKFVTDKLPGALELEFEKVYRTFLILTKKRYAGWKFEYSGGKWHDDIEMKGIETVRRDWCSLVSEITEEVLNILLKEGDLKKAMDKVKEVLDRIKNNEVPLEKLTIIKGITKDPDSYEGMLPHIEAARKMGKRDPFNAPKVGDRIGFVIVKGNGLLSKRAEDPKYVKEKKLQVDADYYIESQLLPPIERILSAAGIERGDILGSGHQMSLGDIMNGSKRKMKHDIKVDYTGKKKEKEEKTLGGWEEFVCKSCHKGHRSMPLNGLCSCGGEILLSYHGSVGKKAAVG